MEQGAWAGVVLGQMGYGPAYPYFVGVILGFGVQKKQERVLVAQYSFLLFFLSR